MPFFAIVVAALAAGAILLIVIGLAGSSPVDPVQARLTQLGTMQAKNLEELELQQPFVERTLRPLAMRLSGGVSRMTSTSFSEKTEKRLALAGNPGDLRVADWLGIKAIGAIIGAILFFFLFGIVGLLGFLLVIGGLLMRVGKARRDSLRDIVPRTEVVPLTNFIGAIIQAEQLGVSISKVLQVQSEQLRIERRQRAEEQAAKAPIKMLFPLVGCIFPSLFIVILGPAVILIVQNLGSR